MSNLILPEPPAELKRLSLALCKKIRLEIEADGFMPFSRFMEMALYEPGLGYYSAGLHKFGKSGDFVTAPELGFLFAACLANQIDEIASGLASFDILELGAGTGRLAAELLTLLPVGSQPRRYVILERSADLQALQRKMIAEHVPRWQERVTWVTQPPDEPWEGLLLANEVVDALAVERFRVGYNAIEQLGVDFTDGAFRWRARKAPPELERAVRDLGLEFEAPYTSELNLHLGKWLEAVVRHLHKGVALFIDYGYPRAEYYLPRRREGTMMCHYRHRAHGDVFFWPGLQDITAWVDFTALAEAADACGMEVAGYTSQAMFLLGCGLDNIVSQHISESEDCGMRITAETRQLTLPAGMGERFQVMALTRNLNMPLRGFALLDLLYRL